MPAPVAPWRGAPLRVIVAAEKPIDGELSLIAPDGSVAARSRDRQGGPPYFWFAEVASPAPGTWHATLARAAGCGAITREIAVRADAPPRPPATPGSIWPVRNTWNRATENLYSAWIEKLFDAPLDAEPSWPTLREVLHDRSRNVLFNYLGLGEDEASVVISPDCADLVYFLRAYFAFKMGLPFAYSKCSRGGGGAPPKCYGWFTNLSPDPGRPAASFGEYLRVVADAVQSGAVRVAATDDNTDFYTVPLKQETLRPGTVYADPYGHVLMLVRRVPQSGGAAGVFLAVDGEPDGTVARKRFWRGTFLFAHEPALGTPGFKRFRPIVREANGSLRRLTNGEIAKDPQYGDYSPEQAQLGVEAFYDRMDDVMSPAPLDPMRAMKGAIDFARRAGEDARRVGRKRAEVPEQRARRRQHAGRPGDLRDHRRVGGFCHAGARLPAVDRNRRGARLPGSRRSAARALRHAERQERGGGEGRNAKRTGVGPFGAQVHLYAQRWFRVDALAQRRGRSCGGFRNGI